MTDLDPEIVEKAAEALMSEGYGYPSAKRIGTRILLAVLPDIRKAERESIAAAFDADGFVEIAEAVRTIRELEDEPQT